MSRKRSAERRGGARLPSRARDGAGGDAPVSAPPTAAVHAAGPVPAAGSEPSVVTGLGWRGLLTVVGVAALARLVVAEQLAPTVLYRSPQLDAFELLEWAKAIARGDFALPGYPTHGPVYPFFLGGLLALFHGSLRAVRWVQALVGAGACALAASLSARLWRDRRAGLATGLLLALHGPLAFVDTELWEEGLFLLFLISALWLLEGGAPSPRRAGGAGLALGVAAVIRPTALVLLPLWAVAQLVAEPRPRRGRAALALVLGAMLVLVPVVAAVSHAAGTFLLVRGFGAVNVWIGNDPAGGGVQNARLGGEWERLKNAPLRDGVEEAGAIESYFLHRSLARAWGDPWGFLGVQASKLAWLLQAEELRDNHSYYFFRQQSSLLRLLPGFGLTLALAAVGVLELRRRRRMPWHLALFALGMVATVLMALAGLRYRLPLVPAVAVVAGGGVVALWDVARQRQVRRLVMLAVLAFTVGVAAHLRRHERTHNFSEEWVLAGSSLAVEERLEEAEAAFHRALELDPRSALGWDGIGRIRIRQLRSSEAEVAFSEALKRDADLIRSRFHLGQLLLQRGEIAAGLAQLQAALDVAPAYTPALEMLARQLFRRGAPDEAAPLYRRLVRATPRDPAAWEALARVEGALDRPAEALAAARRAAGLAPDRASAWQLMGFLALRLPEIATAQQALARLEQLDGDPAARQLLAAGVQHASGDWAAADQNLRQLLASQPDLAPARQLLLQNAERLGNRAAAEELLRRLGAGR